MICIVIHWCSLPVTGTPRHPLALIDSLALTGMDLHSLALTGILWQSHALSCTHWHSLAFTGNEKPSLALTGTYWNSLAHICHHWLFLALTSTHWNPVAFTKTQQQSLAITGTSMHYISIIYQNTDLCCTCTPSYGFSWWRRCNPLKQTDNILYHTRREPKRIEQSWDIEEKPSQNYT